MTPLPEPQAGASARPTYYAEGRVVRKASVTRVMPDGSTSTTLGFRVCIVDYDIVESGSAIAEMLCQAEHHDALVAALTVCMEAIDYAHADPEAGLPSPSWHWWKAAREALRLAAPAPAREGGR